MKTKNLNILAQTLKIAVLTAMIFVAVASAVHTLFANAPSLTNAHMAVYTASSGEVIKGQVAIMNPTNELKVINAHVQEADNAGFSNQVLDLLNTNLPVCSTMTGGWIRIPEPNLKISANQKVVVRYEIGVPNDITEGCYEALHLEEDYPTNRLSLLHTVIIQIGGNSILKPASPYEGSFNKTATVVAIISLALGLALATKFGANLFIQKRKRRQRK